MLIRYLDQLLLFLRFSVEKDTFIGMFSYVVALIFVFAGILLIINILYRAITRTLTFTSWMYFLLIIFMASGIIYWVSIKIPYSVQLFYPIVKPHM